MKNICAILLFGLFFSCQDAYSQLDTINQHYFSNLKAILSQDSNVKEIKLIQEKIESNNGFIQSLYVKYKDDPNSRYWHIGKEFIYNTSNNSLGFISKVDIKTKTLSDTSFSYFPDGTIAALYIYNLKYDSIISEKRGNNIWSGIFGKYYEKMPNVYKSIEYSCDRDTVTEKTFKYLDTKGFVLDGEVVYRDKELRILKKKHYEMGIEVAIIDETRKSVFIDSRDGKSYPTILIGNQIWMAKNLAFKPTEGKCWEYEKGYAQQFGYLYNWETSQNVCPDGWHLPSKQEFDTLFQNSGGNDLKAYIELIPYGSSGFSAVFGSLKFGVNYTSVGSGTAFWSSSENGKRLAWGLTVGRLEPKANVDSQWNKNFGLSVRCIKTK